MRPATLGEELELNRAAYEANRDRIRQAGSGHFAAIAAGRLIAITTDFDEAVRSVEALVPPPSHVAVFPADEEPALEIIDDFGGGLV